MDEWYLYVYDIVHSNATSIKISVAFNSTYVISARFVWSLKIADALVSCYKSRDAEVLEYYTMIHFD